MSSLHRFLPFDKSSSALWVTFWWP